MPLPTIVADLETQLATAIAAGATTFTISSNLDDDGAALPNGLYYWTIDKASPIKEYLAGTLTGSVVSGVVSVSRQGVETSGAQRAHRVGATVILTDFNSYKKYMDGLALAGAPTATPAVLGVSQLSVAAAAPAAPVVVGDNDPRMPTVAQVAFLASVAGMVIPFVGTAAPTGFLLCDGSTYDCDTYPVLAALTLGRYGIGTLVTFTASGNTLTASGHGLSNGNIVYVQNSGGALPTGLAANTPYYVIASTTNTFQVSLTSGGSAVTLSSAGSGTNSFSNSFKVPDLRGRNIIGSGTGTKVATIASVAANVVTATGLTNANNNEFQTGQAVVFGATVAGNLVNASTYYLVRVSNTSFSLATNLANAQAGTLITLAGSETGTFTLTLTPRTAGDTGGEEYHSQTAAEVAAHAHSLTIGNSTAGSGILPPNGSGSTTPQVTQPAGSNTPANVMSPFAVMNFIVKT